METDAPVVPTLLFCVWGRSPQFANLAHPEHLATWHTRVRRTPLIV